MIIAGALTEHQASLLSRSFFFLAVKPYFYLTLNNNPMKEELKCCLCGTHIEDGFGNNPEPVSLNEEDRCCDDCNAEEVIPARLAMMFI
jgi:hypothetical protein